MIRFIAFVLLLLVPRIAAAQERYAVVLGNNRGEPGELPLQYAEDDARRFAGVLRELGGVRAEDLVISTGEDATSARRAIIRVNERIRGQSPRPTELVVYYSGHADSEALHLGGSRFALSELESLVQGSAATFRLLIVDACRSGAITRVKGGKVVPALAVPALEARPSGEGAVFLTASAAREDAQESDELRASFFTHYLVTGLRGVADEDGDGTVDLTEAYAFAYGSTLRASSRTLAGTQHPTYRHDLKGQGRIVLTRWRAAQQQSQVVFPPGDAWLLFRGSSQGPVTVEIPRSAQQRTVAVPGDTYFVRGRTERGLLEGTFAVAPGRQIAISDVSLTRVEYARLVRKGASDAPGALSGIHLGYRGRGSLEAAGELCHGGFAGYSLDLRDFIVIARVGACRGGFENRSVTASSYELDAELRLHHAFDLPWITLEVGAGLGGSWLAQRFESEAVTRPRDAFAGHGDATLALVLDLGGALHARIEGAAMLYLFQREEAAGSRFTPVFTPGLVAGVGYYF